MDNITFIYFACIDKFSTIRKESFIVFFSLELVKFDISTCAFKQGIRVCFFLKILFIYLFQFFNVTIFIYQVYEYTALLINTYFTGFPLTSSNSKLIHMEQFVKKETVKIMENAQSVKFLVINKSRSCILHLER